MKWNLGVVVSVVAMGGCGGSIVQDVSDGSAPPPTPGISAGAGANTSKDDAGAGYWAVDAESAPGVPGRSATCSVSYPSHYALTYTIAIPVPSQSPAGIAFDGDELWVLGVVLNDDGLKSTISRLDTMTAAIDRTFVLDLPDESSHEAHVSGLAWDGEQLWTSVSSLSGGAIVRVSPATGAITRQLAVPTGFTANGVAFDGANLWISSPPNDVYSIDPYSGVVVEHFDGQGALAMRPCELWETTSEPGGSGFDGFNIVDPSNGVTAATGVLGLPLPEGPGPATFIGDRIAVANNLRGVSFYSIVPY